MNKSVVAFGLLMSVLGLAVSFIMGLSVGAASQDSLSFSSDTLSAWVSALATVCIAILTIFLAKETWALRLMQINQIEKIRKDSIKPNIDLYLKNSPVGFNFIDIHIVNNGSGVAQNIKFAFVNKNTETQDVYEKIQEYFNKLVILKNGISSLGSGENRSSFLFSFIELHELFGDKALEYMAEVNIQFEDIEGKSYISKSFFNFTEYKGISELGGGDPLYKISNTLDKLQKDFGHTLNGFKKVKTDVYTSADRKEKNQEREQRRTEMQNKQKND